MTPSHLRAHEFEAALLDRLRAEFPSYSLVWNAEGDREFYTVIARKGSRLATYMVSGLRVEMIRRCLLVSLIAEVVQGLKDLLRRNDGGVG